MYLVACVSTVALIPVCYVSSLYLFDRHQLHTDHPQTIKRRLFGVYLSTTAICTWTYFLLKQQHADPLHSMGLFVDSNTALDTLKAVAHGSSIYLGIFVMNYLDGSLQSGFRKSYNLTIHLPFQVSALLRLHSWCFGGTLSLDHWAKKSCSGRVLPCCYNPARTRLLLCIWVRCSFRSPTITTFATTSNTDYTTLEAIMERCKSQYAIH